MPVARKLLLLLVSLSAPLAAEQMRVRPFQVTSVSVQVRKRSRNTGKCGIGAHQPA